MYLLLPEPRILKMSFSPLKSCGICDAQFYVEDQTYCNNCTIQLDDSLRENEPATPQYVEHREEKSWEGSHPECLICAHTAYPIASTACCDRQLCLSCIRQTLSVKDGDAPCPYCNAGSLMTTVIKVNREADTALDAELLREEDAYNDRLAAQILAGATETPTESGYGDLECWRSRGKLGW